jgi:enoyl-[acyl-carrier protein] reductase II
MMKKDLTELLNLRYPIIAGAMAWISDAILVSAVCNAGGSGVLTSVSDSTIAFKAEIAKCKNLTDKAFGCNIPLNSSRIDEIIDVIIDGKPAYVTLGAGNPVPHIEKFHDAGIMVFAIVPSLRLGKRLSEAGADAIIIEGMESGGHIGTLTTMALLTNVVPEIKNIPVIAAGGIVDGRGIAAALLMGADGVQLGSRFLLANECAVHPNYKKKIIESVDTDIVEIGYGRNSATRCIRNNFTERYTKLDLSGAPKEELDKLAAGTSRMALREGDVVNGAVQVGQSVIPLKKTQSIAEIMEELLDETNSVLASASNIKFYSSLRNHKL